VGIAVLFVSVLFLVPLPLIQLVPALLVDLMSLAYLEEDGFCSVYCLSGPPSYWRLQLRHHGEQSLAPLGSAGSSEAFDAFTAASHAGAGCTP
jgi:Exopolysaccharide synthesis, ExoD